MSKTVEINQIHHAKLLLNLNSLAEEMGDHRDSAEYYEKLERLVYETIDKLSQIVLEEL